MKSIECISITQQVLGRCLPWKSLDELLRRPFGSRMFRHIEANNPAAIDGRHRRAPLQPLAQRELMTNRSDLKLQGQLGPDRVRQKVYHERWHGTHRAGVWL